MATFPTITQTGGPQEWWCWGGGITNHEVFAFTLQSAEHDVGALISNVSVFRDTDEVGGQISYMLDLAAVNTGLHSVFLGITGNFESNGV